MFDLLSSQPGRDLPEKQVGGRHRRSVIVRKLVSVAPMLVFLTLGSCRYDRAVPEQTGIEPDARLVTLSSFLKSVLEQGMIPDMHTNESLTIALADPDTGAVADYAEYISYVREYNRLLESTFDYTPLETLTRLKEYPLDTPWAADIWVRSIDSVGEPSDFLKSGRPQTRPDGTAPVPPGRPQCRPETGTDGTASWQDMTVRLMHQYGNQPKTHEPGITERSATNRLDSLVSAMETATWIMNTEAYRDVSSQERELVRFILPWICDTGSRYLGKSKGAPPYAFHTHFHPPDPFAPGQRITKRLNRPVPPRLYSMTGVYHYLRAMSGQPTRIDGIAYTVNKPGSHPDFECRIDFDEMTRAFSVVAEELTEENLRLLRKELLRMWKTRGDQPDLIINKNEGFGEIIIGGPGNNVYSNPVAALIIDTGGDDSYIYRDKQSNISEHPVCVVVDLGGNDVYRAEGVGGPGAGITGIGILVDLSGDDIYCQGLSPDYEPREHSRKDLLRPDPEAPGTRLVPCNLLYGNHADTNAPGVKLNAGFAFGAGFLGIGCLADMAGNDQYLVQKYSLGAAMWRGVGVLRDGRGDDLYVAGLASEGAGINYSFGFLCDLDGNDHYQCLGHHENSYSVGKDWDNGYKGCGIGFGASWRVEARSKGPNTKRQAACPAGMGIVHDFAGKDTYTSGSFGVASAYAGGAGIIVDESGDDTFFVRRAPGRDGRHIYYSGNHALANGCHRGFGYLLDRAGNDTYSASSLGGGNAWDIGAGYLLDLGGNDSMIDLHGEGYGGNTGWAAAQSLAVSYHFGGIDSYRRETYGNAAKYHKRYPGKAGNFAFFIDIGPEMDDYPESYGNNMTTTGGISIETVTNAPPNTRGTGLFIDGREMPR